MYILMPRSLRSHVPCSCASLIAVNDIKCPLEALFIYIAKQILMWGCTVRVWLLQSTPVAILRDALVTVASTTGRSIHAIAIIERSKPTCHYLSTATGVDHADCLAQSAYIAWVKSSASIGMYRRSSWLSVNLETRALICLLLSEFVQRIAWPCGLPYISFSRVYCVSGPRGDHCRAQWPCNAHSSQQASLPIISAYSPGPALWGIVQSLVKGHWTRTDCQCDICYKVSKVSTIASLQRW